MKKSPNKFPAKNPNHFAGDDRQLPLFLSNDDCFDFPPFGCDPFRGLKSGEDIEAYLRTACRKQFVVKEHQATRHHYDFRLGWNWVLKSWAVPKGPSYCPDHSREAIEVEDHRKEYLGFEGVFPEGKPGAGPIINWDAGLWVPQPGYFDVDQALRNGEIRFTLDGVKLKGNWILSRSDKRVHAKPVWVLTKEHDSYARSENEVEIVDERRESVSSGDTLEEAELRWNRGKRKAKSDGTLFEM